MIRFPAARSAIGLVLALGVVSLLADATYEGARSVAGPYLAILGASAAAVSIVAGAGELLGYTLRLVSGYVSDRARSPWTLAFAGYALNLLAVPCLALAGRWEVAAALLILERVGRALRTPVRDAMLSYAARQVGAGRAYGLHEALDQAGAVAGPLVVALVLAFTGSHRVSFAVLLLPALGALTALAWTRRRHPRPRALEAGTVAVGGGALPGRFWVYLAGVSLLAAGFADFPLIAFHFRQAELLGPSAIPLVYALVMGVDAGAALLLGWAFDRLGIKVVALAALLASPGVPLVFLGGTAGAVGGAMLWGVGMAAQESVLKAAIVGMSPVHRRGIVFGLFDAVHGVFWFLGSVALGLLYARSLLALVLLATGLQLAAALVFLLVSLREQAPAIPRP